MKHFSLVCLLIYSQVVLSQNTTITAEYDMIINLDQPKHYVSQLEFGNGISYYHWNNTENRSSSEVDDFGNAKFYIDITDSIGTINMVDYHIDSMSTRSLRLMDIFVLKEKRPLIEWKLLNEQKNIGKLLANKAICRFRGRNYTAWYSKQIPSAIGPWKLNGLPGMILEVHEEDNIMEIYFKSIRISSDGINDLTAIFSAGQSITLKEYAESQNNLADELVKKIASKLPRGTSISVDSKTENFIEREFTKY
ncbi:MAG: GLPGLI family protein [Maribacter sp.]|nr:GLPGLI family protein [Maribacter sp.]